MSVSDSIATIQQVLLQEPIDPGQQLVVLDMDRTLTLPPRPALAYLFAEKYQIKLQRMLAPFNETERNRVLKLGSQVSNQQLVESDAPAIIRSI